VGVVTIASKLRKRKQEESQSNLNENDENNFNSMPKHSMVFSILIGSGVQIFSMLLALLLLGVSGILLAPNRGCVFVCLYMVVFGYFSYLITYFIYLILFYFINLCKLAALTAILVLYCLMGFLAGLFSTRTYLSFGGTKLFKHAFLVCLFFFLLVFFIFKSNIFIFDGTKILKRIFSMFVCAFFLFCLGLLSTRVSLLFGEQTKFETRWLCFSILFTYILTV
jgi:hypothetical protein